MKAVAVLLTALLSAQCLVVVRGDDCVSACRTQLHQSSEGDCARWREELPRPDLYSHCQEGYTKGREAACAEYCKAAPNGRHLDSLRLDACTHLRGRPPAQRVSACNDGYAKARARAEKVVAARGPEPVNPAAPAGGSEPKRKLTINSQTSAKNVLEAAREEAVAAFQEAKSADL